MPIHKSISILMKNQTCIGVSFQCPLEWQPGLLRILSRRHKAVLTLLPKMIKCVIDSLTPTSRGNIWLWLIWSAKTGDRIGQDIKKILKTHHNNHHQVSVMLRIARSLYNASSVCSWFVTFREPTAKRGRISTGYPMSRFLGTSLSLPCVLSTWLSLKVEASQIPQVRIHANGSTRRQSPTGFENLRYKSSYFNMLIEISIDS